MMIMRIWCHSSIDASENLFIFKRHYTNNKNQAKSVHNGQIANWCHVLLHGFQPNVKTNSSSGRQGRGTLWPVIYFSTAIQSLMALGLSVGETDPPIGKGLPSCCVAAHATDVKFHCFPYNTDCCLPSGMCKETWKSLIHFGLYFKCFYDCKVQGPTHTHSYKWHTPGFGGCRICIHSDMLKH